MAGDNARRTDALKGRPMLLDLSPLPSDLSLSDACDALAVLCLHVEALAPDGVVITLSRLPDGGLHVVALERGRRVA